MSLASVFGLELLESQATALELVLVEVKSELHLCILEYVALVLACVEGQHFCLLYVYVVTHGDLTTTCRHL